MKIADMKRIALSGAGIIASLSAQCADPGIARSAAAPASGKYCVNSGSTMLVARQNSNGNLDFGISLWTGRGHNFSVSGSAQPNAGGWRFRENMTAADPAQRCEIVIGRLPNGGYTLSVTPAGSCEDEGGQGAAPLPNQKIVFPASSRDGALPRNKSVAEAVSLESGGLSCAKSR